MEEKQPFLTDIKTLRAQHADQIAARIVQLQGEPDFSPEGLAIDSYREMLEYIGDKDTTTKRMLEDLDK